MYVIGTRKNRFLLTDPAAAEIAPDAILSSEAGMQPVRKNASPMRERGD
jgi:hypothetical protein